MSYYSNTNLSRLPRMPLLICKKRKRQQASLLAAVVDCDRKYVPNNVYGSYLRVMVEPRGVEPLSESTFTVTSPGAVCLFTFPP